jgi:hypothetical protein
MPFKGDMRLGGRHSNVATLNGTASEFGVLAAGTVISVTDTSRYEYDGLGTAFYMPYSTTMYADGLGGQTSVETWGLQYYPAGWYIGSYSYDLVYTAPCQSFVFGVASGGLFAAGDGVVNASGNTTYSPDPYLGYCGDQDEGWHFYYLDDVNGNPDQERGVRTGPAPIGFVLYYQISYPSFEWSAHEVTGTYVYAHREYKQTVIDNMNNVTAESRPIWEAPSGQQIYSGSYVWGQDEYGNDLHQNFTVNFTGQAAASEGGGFFNVFYYVSP